MKTKVLIEVKGGNVQNIYSNTKNLDIVIVDHDCADIGEQLVSDIVSPDAGADDLYTLFTNSDPRTMEIHEALKRIHF